MARPGERQDIVERAVHVFDRTGDPRTFGVVLDRLDPYSQSRERRLEIVADRAKHDVLLVEQGADPVFHGVVRQDQPAHIVRAFGGNLVPPVAGSRKLFGPAGQGRERAGDPAQDKGDGANKNGIDHQCLTDQGQNQHAPARRHHDPGDQPAAVALALHRRDQQPIADRPSVPDQLAPVA
jgi:hypothetical protein